MKVGIKQRISMLVALAIAGCIVTAAIDLKVYWDGLIKERRAMVRSHVEAAASIVHGYARASASGELSIDQAQEHARRALRQIRYGNNEYILVYDHQGMTIAHGVQPKLEGTSRWDVKDSRGIQYVPEIIKAARAGGGFVSYHFPRVGSDIALAKLTYAQNVEPWNWVVGSGIYTDDLDELLVQRIWYSGLTTLALLLMLSVIGLSVAGSVIRPLRRLSQAMGALAQGTVDTDVPALERTDEIGQMAKAVLVFRDAAVDKIRMEKDAEHARLVAEQDRIHAEQQAIAQERAIVCDSIGAGMAKLAAKDLTYRLTANLPKAYSKLQIDFNHAIAQLEQAMQDVHTSTGMLGSGTQEIATAADDLATRTEQQAASLEQTAATLDQITATGKKAAEGADHARQLVTTAKQDAEKTDEVVRRTVEAMGGIEKSAQRINQIIGVIDEIAFQTNLLALNAGVEAARAGDAGRGFAVVASEVRALAQRSAEAAKEIKGLILESSGQVAEGVNLVAETGNALGRILEQVNDISRVVVDIAAGAQEQAIGLGQVNTAIGQMDQLTQQNAAMVEETTAASHSLLQETSQLVDLIEQFRVGETALSNTDRGDMTKVSASGLASKTRKPSHTAAKSSKHQASAA